MKYIRTKSGVTKLLENAYVTGKKFVAYVQRKEGRGYDICWEPVIAQSDNLKDLCDCFSYDTETTTDFDVAGGWKLANPKREIYGCIKTRRGLIYVAKINDKGELELL